MNIEKIGDNMRQNYRSVENYLQGDPGVEGFLNTLTNLESNISDYLIEILKKKYGKDFEKSNIYQRSIKGKSKYVADKRVEGLITKEILGKKVSIESLFNEGIQKVEELFKTRSSFEKALLNRTLTSISVNGVILPPDDLHSPQIGSNNGFEKKHLEQNKLRLFISTLKEFGIYHDDLIFYLYHGIINENMVRENTYYAIYIPRINKTIFLNTGYGEATFVCNGEVSIQQMTTLGKEKLQSELGAIKIKFFENNIEGWKNALKNSLLGEGGKVGEKVKIREIKSRINSQAKLHELISIFNEIKDICFTTGDGKTLTIEDLFSGTQGRYKTCCIYANEALKEKGHNIKLYNNFVKAYGKNWREIQETLGLKHYKPYIGLNELVSIFPDIKDISFTTGDGKTLTIEDLFSGTREQYTTYYKYANQAFEEKGHNFNLYNDIMSYGKNWREIQETLGLKHYKPYIGLNELVSIFPDIKDISFTTGDGKTLTIEDLFSGTCMQYWNYYKYANQALEEKGHNFLLNSEPRGSYKKSWRGLQETLGLKHKHYIGLNELVSIFPDIKDISFTTGDGKTLTIDDLFSGTREQYTTYCKYANQAFEEKGHNFKFYIKILDAYGKGWNDIKKALFK